jgi:hypothetical protein
MSRLFTQSSFQDVFFVHVLINHLRNASTNTLKLLRRTLSPLDTREYHDDDEYFKAKSSLHVLPEDIRISNEPFGI